MEFNNLNEAEIKSGFDACPSCDGDEWKSARMVVMEGTTNAKGTLNGQITDPGALSGGLKNFLLSDRWFSWEYTIETEVGLTSMTGLVEEIKRLMISHGSKFKIQTPPAEPAAIDPLEQIIPEEPQKPPTEPPVPKPPDLPEKKPWYIHFSNALKGFGVLALVGGSLFAFFVGPLSFLIALAIFVIGIPFVWINSFQENRRQLNLYKKQQQLYPNLVDEANKKHRSACDQYEKDLQIYGYQCTIADRQKSEEELAIAAYRKELDDYELEKQDVMAARELLWKRARVCMRCGTAYLGSDYEATKTCSTSNPANQEASMEAL